MERSGNAGADAMKLRPTLRGLGRLALLMTGLALLAALIALHGAQIEMTPGGAHKRLLIPVFRQAIAIPIYTGTGEHVLLPDRLDGPVVRRVDAHSWTSTWYCQDAVHRQATTGNVLEITCAGKRHAYSLATVRPPPAISPMPAQVVVLSDLEGNSTFMEAALRALSVTGDNGTWTFGTGHLVILGDSVDRGQDVFAVLWRLRALAAQAQAAGGAVHVLLGNHEQYVLQANPSRAHPDHRYALKAMGGYSQAFAADTVIGAWLREQPVTLTLGRVLFVHGGISPAVLETGLGVPGLNAAMHAYWKNEAHGGHAQRDGNANAVLGLAGVTRYRGYFEALAASYPAATQAQIDETLTQFNVDQIVVGHTLVDRVKQLHGGRVWAVDVNDDEAAAEALVFTNGVPRVVALGVARNLGQEPSPRRRRLNLLDTRDWQLLIAMGKEFWTLSRIPQAQ
ncbi:metallophosphoesterase [Pseudoxanthomonas sp.]|uniref:metallophosphoesterase n=1 Tax=Pseudoxanthomonas sp. TaxID=1871049 RepID=UPI002630364D|nr:metallophosphoesterase [Pseudoxanthomonas sp.]WDS35287.1 MAG: metallophosphoesterase [Pseudoxanthomonas sp.]